MWVSVRSSETDLLFAISFSVAVFQLIFPFLIYNDVMLMPGALWLAKYAACIRACSPRYRLLWNLSAISLGSGFAATAALSMVNLILAGAASKLWSFPLVAAWILPLTVFLALAACAATPPVISQLWRAE